MNLKSTLALVVLLLAVLALFGTGAALPPALAPFSTSAPVAEAVPDPLPKLTESALRRVEIRKADATVTLERTPGGDWVMPGNWPTRSAEVRRLVGLLVGLRSRFAPLAIQPGEDLSPFGLDRPAVSVSVTTDDGGALLHFGEGALGVDADRFDRPTYARVGEGLEVVRLGPGVVSALDRPADYYQQRRLFPAERATRADGADKVDRLAAASVTAESAGERFTLTRAADGWEMSAPFRDRLDPARRDALLEAVPDLWAERFVTPPPSGVTAGWMWALGAPAGGPAALASALFWGQNQTTAAYGLLTPERSLNVTRPDGVAVTLEVGRPLPSLGGKPRAWARLKSFDRVFEVGTDKLASVFVPAANLRDDQVARFKVDDVRRLEIAAHGTTVVLVNEAPRNRPEGDPPPPPMWKLLEPTAASADGDMVRDLLGKLSNLTAKDRDALTSARARAVAGGVGLLTSPNTGLLPFATAVDGERAADTLGLTNPSVIVRLTAEEKVKGESEAYKATAVRLTFGGRDRERKSLYVRLDDWPRVDEIDDAVAETLLDKRSMDYRGKKLFDFAAADVDQLTVGRRWPLAVAPPIPPSPTGLDVFVFAARLAFDRTGAFTLGQEAGEWRLLAPVKTPADATKAGELADRLAGLNVLQFVADLTQPDVLPRDYGLTAPTLTVRATFKGARKPTTLEVGKAREGAPGYFARVEDRPEVFVLADDVVRLLERDALAYRPAELWRLASPAEVTGFRVHKAGQEPYALRRKGDGWEVTGPFTVEAPKAVVERLAAALSAPKAEGYRAHEGADPRAFGLDRPRVTVTVTAGDGKEHSLQIGAAEPGGTGRYARTGDGGAVFTVGEELVRTVDVSALDFLDRKLWAFDPGAAVRFRRRQGDAVVEVEKKDDAWALVKPAGQAADERKVTELLQKLGDLQAARVAAYPARDLKPFGLDVPSATVTVSVGTEKPTEYVLDLGVEVGEAGGDRYALVKGSPKVAVLPRELVGMLLAGPLTYADHQLARFSDADRLVLEAGRRKATFRRVEGTWRMTEPLATAAEHEALEAFLEELYRLRGDELVAEKPSADDLQRYGLDRPAVRWRVFNGDKEELDLAVGAAQAPGGRRYARVPGKDVVALLDAKLSAGVTAEYRPRGLLKESVDPAQVEAVRFGYKNGPFELRKGPDANWQVAGRPEATLELARVNETLAVLRDLKLERFVADRPEGLELYGLSPPELVLEVTTPSGKRVLHLGGRVGDSRQRYGLLPTGDAKGVFVLDAAASDRLFRDLPALSRRAE